MDKSVYSLAEVAEAIGFGYQTVYKWVRAGRIKAVQFGSDWRVSHEELQRLYKEGLDPEHKKQFINVSPDGAV